MGSKSDWGGSRPKRRDDDARGGVREGAGRKRERFTARLGESYVAERETIGGEIRPPEMWRVLSVEEDCVEFQCGDDIIVLRKPDDE